MTSLGKLFSESEAEEQRRLARKRMAMKESPARGARKGGTENGARGPMWRDLIFNNIVIKTCNEPGRWDVNFVYGRSQS